MLNYDDLSPSQQKFIDLTIIHFPELAQGGKCTYKELMHIHETFVSYRAKDKAYKMSKPLWLITNNAIERGVYQLPLPNQKIEVNITNPMELMYRAELKRFGIKPKA